MTILNIAAVAVCLATAFGLAELVVRYGDKWDRARQENDDDEGGW